MLPIYSGALRCHCNATAAVLRRRQCASLPSTNPLQALKPGKQQSLLEGIVGFWACIASCAAAIAQHIAAHHRRIVARPKVPASGLLSMVHVKAGVPIVGAPLRQAVDAQAITP